MAGWWWGKGGTQAARPGRLASRLLVGSVADVVHHHAPGVTDRASIQKIITATLDAIPDFRIGTEAAIAEGDLVVLRQTLNGTQQGEFMRLPASGKQFSAKGMYALRIVGGKITDLWGLSDTFGIMQQLGAIPTPERA